MGELRKPARVLHVLRPAAGGMRGHVLQLAAGLASHGFECQIACPGDSDIVQSALAAGIEVRPVGIVGPVSPLRDVEAVAALVDVIRRGGFDIVHCHGAKAGFLGRSAARIACARRTVLTIHNDVLAGLRPVEVSVVKWVERALGRRTTRVIAVSDALHDSLTGVEGLDPDRVVTVRNGIDLDPYLAPVDPGPVRDRYGIPRDALVFGCAARFAPQKGQDVLVAAAESVLERCPHAWFLLAGDGPLLEPTKRLARGGRAAERVVFPGFETDVRGMLAALDIFVIAPSSEGLGVAAIEAMAAGRPVVSLRVGGIPEVVRDGETGILVPPGDTPAFADAMVRLARDPVLRHAMGDASRRRAFDEFSEQRMLERTARVYREVLCSDS